jgi:glycosyltransferase involved in cell wall biosynthesis
MRVLLVGESLAATFGGTAAAIGHLANYLRRAGVDVACATVDTVPPETAAVRLDADVRMLPVHTIGPRRLGFSPDISAAIAGVQPEIVHVHGLWRLHFAQALAGAERRCVPAMISVHGMLHRGALDQRARGKSLARMLFQDRRIHRTACLHATAPAEAEAIRSAGFRNPIAIVPWGVEVPLSDTAAERPAVARPPTVLYLGRLHPGKGLETLLHAWRSVHSRFASARLVLAGPDEEGYEGRLKALARELAVADSVIFAGAADAGSRERLYASATLAVLPSPAENFGFAVPEALARSVPVIATRGAPWEVVAAERCGWWVIPGAAPLAAALDDALRLPPDALREMGARGRRLVLERFTWERAATSMIEVYAWMRGSAPLPAFVKIAC